MWGWVIRTVMSRALFANIVVGLLAVTILGGGALAWYTKYQIQKGQALRWKVDELEIAISGWQDKYKEQLARAKALEEVERLHEEDNAHREAVTAALAAELARLRRENVEVETYMAQPVPADILERLSAHREAASGTGD